MTSRRRRERRQHEVWSSLGEADPDWAVLTDRDLRHRGWEADLDRFYASGREVVEAVLGRLPDVERGRALDFGCGTGRLSLALAEHFAHVTAVDIAEAMLATTRKRAKSAGIENITTSSSDDLRPGADHDFAMSLLVLQHLPDRQGVSRALALIAGCVRSGGWLCVELPVSARTLRARSQPRFRVYRVLRRVGVRPQWLHRHGLSGISMLTLSEDWVRRTLSDLDVTVLHTEDHDEPGHVQRRYFGQVGRD